MIIKVNTFLNILPRSRFSFSLAWSMILSISAFSENMLPPDPVVENKTEKKVEEEKVASAPKLCW